MGKLIDTASSENSFKLLAVKLYSSLGREMSVFVCTFLEYLNSKPLNVVSSAELKMMHFRWMFENRFRFATKINSCLNNECTFIRLENTWSDFSHKFRVIRNRIINWILRVKRISCINYSCLKSLFLRRLVTNMKRRLSCECSHNGLRYKYYRVFISKWTIVHSIE